MGGEKTSPGSHHGDLQRPGFGDPCHLEVVGRGAEVFVFAREESSGNHGSETVLYGFTMFYYVSNRGKSVP